MTNDEYARFEGPFRESARPLLERIRSGLVEMGFGPFTDIEVTDHDVDRGLEFRDVGDPERFVELKLTDGDAHGFEGVGLALECSNFMSGMVWAPGNYTPDVSITEPDEVVRRVKSCPFGDVVAAVAAEWRRIEQFDSPAPKS